ncbi:hypothetical protein J2Z40_001641 [Cytobacillus eiseniae]|uniref:DUF3995 domain-containing protein n=1 Tax=Cytobacillus eiseniae TaxID=762947 RepID=A0ABS4RFI5_9BACI|nr:hypothetical protein [Cytobacillus eiseniae]MBP2241079.1 hypothetical protein [Cytobacillus eiseniae]
MSGIITAIYTIGILLLAGGVHFYLAIKKPRVYPPKHILRKRATALGAGGICLLLLGIIIHSFQ